MATHQSDTDLERTLAASLPFVGRWNELVSTTNWEKGQIVSQWREALIAAGAAATQYSDDAWSLQVGGVTPQHVGRLRRVFQRFGTHYRQYPGLYWSHFQAAIDWPDAEMWLEGAVQNHWSVSIMRTVRWEATGSVAALKPSDEDIVATEPEEDYVAQPVGPAGGGSSDARERQGGRPSEGPLPEGPDFGDESLPPAGSRPGATDEQAAQDRSTHAEVVRPFANLPVLPDDLAEPFDAFKLAMLRHKTDGWRDVSCADVLAALDALKSLALARR